MYQWTRETLDRSRLEIDDDTLTERNARIEPFLLREGELYRFDRPGDLRRTAFTWEPKGLVLVNERFDFDSGKSLDWYVEVSRGTTHHSCGYHGFFKPSIAEVLAQLPDDPSITAFYLDIDSVKILDQGEGHIANVFWLTNQPRNEEWQRARIEKMLARDRTTAEAN